MASNINYPRAMRDLYDEATRRRANGMPNNMLANFVEQTLQTYSSRYSLPNTQGEYNDVMRWQQRLYADFMMNQKPDASPYVGGRQISKNSGWSSPFEEAMIMPLNQVNCTVDIGQPLIPEPGPGSKALAAAKKALAEMTTILENIKKEPLILYSIDRLTKDNKHAFVKKGRTDLRIQSCPDLARGDEVLLHPKTYQIVERLEKPPLNQSRFSQENIPNVSWDDIGGLDEAKADLKEAIELPHQYKKLFVHYGKKQVKGILLSGPPGCGKTMLGKAAATSLAGIYGQESAKTGFLYVKGPEILDCYVGQTEQTIRDMFFDAYRHKEEHGYPAVIFLDEADAILAARGSRNVGIGNTIVPTFLTEMDGLVESSAIIIVATNLPECLDPAIIRDGRIDRKVLVSRPTLDNAEKIIMLNLKKVPLINGLELKEAAKVAADAIYHVDRFVQKGVRLSDVVNGAMLANVVSIATSYAMRRDIENSKQTGITIDDIKLAVYRIQQQSAALSSHI